MIVDCAHYVRGMRERKASLTLEEAASCRRSGGSFVWLDLHEPDTRLMEEIRTRFGLHELAVEDAANAHQRPKVESYDDFHFIVLRPARYDHTRKAVAFGELHLFLAPGYVIAVRHGETGDPASVGKRLRQRPALLRSGPAGAVWAILDTVVDDYGPVVEELENDVDEVEEAIFAGDVDPTKRLYTLKQEVNDVYRAVHPLLVPLEAVEKGAFTQMNPGLLRYFRDVRDHLERVNDEILAQRERLNSAFQANAALISVRQNEIGTRQSEIIKQLTVVATVFLPLSFVVGFFGQNFAWLADNIDSVAAFVALGLGGLVVACVVLYVWFRRRRFT